MLTGFCYVTHIMYLAGVKAVRNGLALLSSTSRVYCLAYYGICQTCSVTSTCTMCPNQVISLAGASTVNWQYFWLTSYRSTYLMFCVLSQLYSKQQGYCTYRPARMHFCTQVTGAVNCKKFSVFSMLQYNYYVSSRLVLSNVFGIFKVQGQLTCSLVVLYCTLLV